MRKFLLLISLVITSTSVLADNSSVLHQLFDDERAFYWRENPLTASDEGVSDYDDRLGSVQPADFERRLGEDKNFLARLNVIDRATLSIEDQTSYDLFAFVVKNRVDFAAFQPWRTPLTSDEGFYIAVMQMHQAADTRSVRGYERYIARLQDVPRFFKAQIANMRQGMREGFTLPSVVLPGIQKILDAQQMKSAQESELYAPFKKFPEFFSQADRDRLDKEGREAITTAIIPAFRELRDFFVTEYAPQARKNIAASDLPNGRDYYTQLVRYYASYDIAPDTVHEIGLREVARIRHEMDEVIAQTKFKGSFDAFLTFLRTSPQFYETTPLGLLKTAAYIAKEVDGKLPQFFATLPRMTYRVEPVPEELAPNYTTGRYNPGPDDGRTSGTYWVNTYALKKRPLYALPSLTLHEAVPGHHLQGALARELKKLPAFRRNIYIDAFGEGWGLYSEKLGLEMGIYKTPFEHFGRLSYEMWRACRLVVDTGMHWKGWTRQQAVDYLKRNTALPEYEIQTETDRYISWPGQALSYKLGEMKIWELRRKAEKALGAKFDIRSFHDALIDSGTMTMPMLERQIERFIAR